MAILLDPEVRLFPALSPRARLPAPEAKYHIAEFPIAVLEFERPVTDCSAQ